MRLPAWKKPDLSEILALAGAGCMGAMLLGVGSIFKTADLTDRETHYRLVAWGLLGLVGLLIAIVGELLRKPEP